MIEVSSLLSLLVTLLIGGLIFWLIWWAIERAGLPEPFHKVAIVVVTFCAVAFLINLLLGLSGVRLFR